MVCCTNWARAIKISCYCLAPSSVRASEPELTEQSSLTFTDPREAKYCYVQTVWSQRPQFVPLLFWYFSSDVKANIQITVIYLFIVLRKTMLLSISCDSMRDTCCVHNSVKRSAVHSARRRPFWEAAGSCCYKLLWLFTCEKWQCYWAPWWMTPWHQVIVGS